MHLAGKISFRRITVVEERGVDLIKPHFHIVITVQFGIGRAHSVPGGATRREQTFNSSSKTLQRKNCGGVVEFMCTLVALLALTGELSRAWQHPLCDLFPVRLPNAARLLETPELRENQIIVCHAKLRAL